MSTTESDRPTGEVVVRGNGRMATRVVHDPASDSTPDDPRPRCHEYTTAGYGDGQTGTWRHVDHAVYPNTRRCKHCQRMRGDGE